MINFIISLSIFLAIIIPLSMFNILEVEISINNNTLYKKIKNYILINYTYFFSFLMILGLNVYYDNFLTLVNILLFLISTLVYIGIKTIIKKKKIKIFDIEFHKQNFDYKGFIKYLILFLITYSLFFIIFNNLVGIGNSVFFNLCFAEKLSNSYFLFLPILYGISYIDSKYSLIPDTLINILIFIVFFLIVNNTIYYISDIPFLLLSYSVSLITIGLLELYMKYFKKREVEVFGYQDPIIILLFSAITGSYFFYITILTILLLTIIGKVFYKKDTHLPLFGIFPYTIIIVLILLIGIEYIKTINI